MHGKETCLFYTAVLWRSFLGCGVMNPTSQCSHRHCANIGAQISFATPHWRQQKRRLWSFPSLVFLVIFCGHHWSSPLLTLFNQTLRPRKSPGSSDWLRRSHDLKHDGLVTRTSGSLFPAVHPGVAWGARKEYPYGAQVVILPRYGSLRVLRFNYSSGKDTWRDQGSRCGERRPELQLSRCGQRC